MFVFAIFLVLQCAFLFLKYFSGSGHMSYTVFLIFNDFQYSRLTPGPTVCIFHFSCFSVFFAIFHIKQCLCLIFHVFSVFLPKSRSHSVYSSYFTFFTISCHIPGPTVCDFHFAHFIVFLATIQVL